MDANEIFKQSTISMHEKKVHEIRKNVQADMVDNAIAEYIHEQRTESFERGAEEGERFTRALLAKP